MSEGGVGVGIGLSAAVVAVERDAPEILVARAGDGLAGLPSGAFEPARDRTIEIFCRLFAS